MEKVAIYKIVLFGLQQLLTVAPAFFARIVQALSKPDVTVEDLTNLREEIDKTPYSKLVPNTGIPPEQQTT